MGVPLPIVFLVAMAGLAGGPARAQCPASGSTCVACHEVRGTRPVLNGPDQWHRDHAFGDLCAACHGGDPAAEDAVSAHAGRRNPLTDPRASCAGCHEQDWAAKAAGYAATPPVARRPAPPPPATTGSANGVLTLVAVALGIALIVLSWQERRPGQAFWRALAPRAKTWSPYLAGAGLGVVVFIAEAVLGRPIAVSGAFDKLAAYLGQPLFPGSPYYQLVMPAGITWHVWLVLGLFAGAFLSARLSGEARLRWLPDTAWQPRFGPSRALRLVLAFGGALLVQIGADIAGGCTSGLAISGGALLAPGAFVFMAAMFGSGIPTAKLFYRGHDRRRDAP